MSLHLGNHVYLDYERASTGVVSEVVPAGRIPRTVRQRNFKPRASESYVVTILTDHQVSIPTRPGVRSYSMGCRRVWPDSAALIPQRRDR